MRIYSPIVFLKDVSQGDMVKKFLLRGPNGDFYEFLGARVKYGGLRECRGRGRKTS